VTVPRWSHRLTHYATKENTIVSDSSTSMGLSIDDLERVTIVTDGGVGGRGSTVVVYLTPKDSKELREAAMERRRA
jgi:hypothetical protein